MNEPGPARSLGPLLDPAAIAVVGASKRPTRANRVVQNLMSVGFGGAIYPVNPNYDEVLGSRCFPSIADTPRPADVVVVAIPAQSVPRVLEEAWAAGVRAAVILSSGFSEAGGPGHERHLAVERIAQRGMLICGPNCWGIINVRSRAAVFSGVLPDPLMAGGVGLISQSGAFSTLIAAPLMELRGVGLSYVISCGNQAGVTVEDYMEHLVEDEGTRVVAALVEGFKRPKKFRQVAARAAQIGKPLIVMKTGLSEAGQEATLAHTGSLAGAADVLAAVLRSCGVVQVHSPNELIETVCLFATTGVRTSGRRIGGLTGSGGECAHALDAAEGSGVVFPRLSDRSIRSLARILPDFVAPRNPVDGSGAMYDDPTVFGALVDTVLADENVDVVAVNLTAGKERKGSRMPDRAFAEGIAAAAAGSSKLIVAYRSIVGGDLDQGVVEPLRRAGVPFLEGTHATLQSLTHLHRYRDFVARDRDEDAAPVKSPVDLPHGGVLTFTATARLLGSFGIPVVATTAARTADQAVVAANRLGYPVVLKVDSPDIVHKTDVGGVRTDLRGPEAVRLAFEEVARAVSASAPKARVDGVLIQPMVSGGIETIIGVKDDPTFGPVVLFGLGGIFTEVLHDVALRVPPISAAEAVAMIDEIRGATLLRGARGRPPVDIAAIARTLSAVGVLAIALQGRLKALDLNPFLVSGEGRGGVALDALVELRGVS